MVYIFASNNISKYKKQMVSSGHCFFFFFAEVLVGPVRRKQAGLDMRRSIVVYRARAFSARDDQTPISPCGMRPTHQFTCSLSTRKEWKLLNQWWLCSFTQKSQLSDQFSFHNTLTCLSRLSLKLYEYSL